MKGKGKKKFSTKKCKWCGGKLLEEYEDCSFCGGGLIYICQNAENCGKMCDFKGDEL